MAQLSRGFTFAQSGTVSLSFWQVVASPKPLDRDSVTCILVGSLSFEFRDLMQIIMGYLEEAVIVTLHRNGVATDVESIHMATGQSESISLAVSTTICVTAGEELSLVITSTTSDPENVKIHDYFDFKPLLHVTRLQ